MMMNTNHNSGEAQPPREEILISRIVDGEAFEDDWRDFELLAHDDARAWERLARAQREHDRLARDVEDAIAIAELVDLPRAEVRVHSLSARIRQYSGWAVAAMLSVALLTVMGVRVGPAGPGSQPAGFNLEQALAQMPPETLREKYLERGREAGLVVGEAPNMLIEMQSSETGSGVEVIIVRQIVEQHKLNDLQMLAEQLNPQTNESTYVPIRRISAPAY